MADLRVDERTLTAVSTMVSTASLDVEVPTTLTAGSAGEVGSTSVAAVLDETTGQLARRSTLAYEAVQAMADFPARFVLEIEQAEARLSRGLSNGDPAGVGVE